MRKEVLDPLGMTRSCMVWRPEYEKMAANGHDLLGKPQEIRRYEESHVAASLYTTAEDYAKFVVAVLAGRDLRPEILKAMLTSQIDMDKEKGLGWSLGFGTQIDRNGPALWQWGDYTVFRNYIIAYPAKKNAVVYLTNGFNGLSICGDVVGRALGGLAMGNIALGYWPYRSPMLQAVRDLQDNGFRAVKTLPKFIRKHPADLKTERVSFLAETFHEAGNDSLSFAIFEAGLEARPRSGAARIELAKAYARNGDHKRARSEFEKARKAEEEKVEAETVDWYIESLDAFEKPCVVPSERLQKIAGDYGPRHLLYRDGRLYYRRDGIEYSAGGYPLTAISPDTFFMDNMLYFRIKIEFDETGNPVKLIGLYNDGTSPDETPRSKNKAP